MDRPQTSKTVLAVGLSSFLAGTLSGCLFVGAVQAATPTPVVRNHAPTTITDSNANSQLWTDGQGHAIADPNYDPGKSLSPMIQAVQPAVVSVTGQRSGQNPQMQTPSGIPPWMLPHLPEQQLPGISQGSGFLISQDGYVVTNHHVVDGQNKLEITLFDGRTFAAKVVGSDPQTDVALLKLERKKTDEALPFVQLGSSERLEVGDWVVAIGNPMGLHHSVTRGIVSAKSRGDLGLYQQGYADFLQTDAAISPGNSGGPLFNLQGEVVAINTAISRVGNDLGFAVPIDQAKGVLRQLKAYGEVRRGWLGISGSAIRKASNTAPQKGAEVAAVQPGGPAQKAGLREKDLIVGINGQEIADFKALRQTVANLEPHQKLEVDVLRDGKKKRLQVTLGRQPSAEELALAASEMSGERSERKSLYGRQGPTLGVRVRKDQEAGIVIDSVEDRKGVAAELGLQPGDRIEAVNGRKITSIESLRKALAQEKDRVQITFRRNGTQHSASLQIR